MKIIIPFTGDGLRFVNAGFDRLKPFILIANKSIIERNIGIFDPKDHKDIIFITRNDHIQKYDYILPTLKQIAPAAQIVILDNAEKKGPVVNIMKIQDLIADDEEIVVNYCDYYMHFNWQKFKEDISIRKCDGAIPCYSGFHPHLLAKNNFYASCKVDNNQNLVAIKEKFSWTDNKEKSLHSAGLYYLKSAKLLKKYYKILIDNNDNINGEFYCSLPYNYMVNDNLQVWCPANVDKFCQWGTPKDLKEFTLFNNDFI